MTGIRIYEEANQLIIEGHNLYLDRVYIHSGTNFVHGNNFIVKGIEMADEIPMPLRGIPNSVDLLKSYEEKVENFRRAGNSTRLVDHAIQLLFEGKKVTVKDHYQNGENLNANKMLFKKVVKRLENEHYNCRFLADPIGMTIKIHSEDYGRRTDKGFELR